jgi:hypothetical protein
MIWNKGIPEINQTENGHFVSRRVIVKTKSGYIMDAQAMYDMDGGEKWYLRPTDDLESLDYIEGWIELP